MKLSISNLSTYASERDLKKLFSPFGNVVSVSITYDTYNHRSRGMAEVDMESESAALVSIQKLHDSIYMLKRLIVKQKDFFASKTK